MNLSTPTPTDDLNQMIRHGRAILRVIQGLEILKEDSGSWRETWLIQLTLALYRHRWEKVRDGLPPNLRARIEDGMENP